MWMQHAVKRTSAITTSSTARLAETPRSLPARIAPSAT
jgi:hypothetical protein